jgi:hypothetical protein
MPAGGSKMRREQPVNPESEEPPSLDLPLICNRF